MEAYVPKPIVIVGEAPGANEQRINSSFVGASGIELLRMLNDAEIITLTSADQDYIRAFYTTSDPHNIDAVWMLHPEVYRTNVFGQHPPGNDLSNFCGVRSEGIRGYPGIGKGLYIREEFQSELDRLKSELRTINPNLIIALGNTPLWALAGRIGIGKLRGCIFESTHTISGFKVLPTYHPAAVIRQWELRPYTVIDLQKANREKANPNVQHTDRTIWIEPTRDDVGEFYRRFIVGCDLLSVDIETSGDQITCIGFAPSKDLAIVIPFFDTRKPDKNYWRSQDDELYVWGIVRCILRDRKIRKVFQNGLYDITFMWRSVGIPTYGAAEDTMLAHHSIMIEALKGLDTLGSLYSNSPAWKHEHRQRKSTIKRDG